MNPKQFTSIGGQAVIEGVMMRSPHFLTIAVRKPDKKIIVKETQWKGIGNRFLLFKKPFLRGVVTLFESMVNGIEALTYSANVAVEHSNATGKKQEISGFAIFTSIFFAFLMGMALFVAAPHMITLWVGKLGVFHSETANPLFHLIDGIIKVFFLVAYIYIISLMNDIRRVFQYHGAEHKSIYAFESGEELTIENARKYSTLHPRCGTSFLLFLLIISILVFSGLFPFIGLNSVSKNVFVHHSSLIIIKILLLFPIAGISYEFIRASAKHMGNPFCRILIFPGLILQKLTTREPTDDQLETALASLRRVLVLEKNPAELRSQELEIATITEIAAVSATVGEFPG